MHMFAGHSYIFISSQHHANILFFHLVYQDI